MEEVSKKVMSVNGTDVEVSKLQYKDVLNNRCTAWKLRARSGNLLKSKTLFGGRISKKRVAEYLASPEFSDQSGAALIHAL